MDKLKKSISRVKSKEEFLAVLYLLVGSAHITVSQFIELIEYYAEIYHEN